MATDDLLGTDQIGSIASRETGSQGTERSKEIDASMLRSGQSGSVESPFKISETCDSMRSRDIAPARNRLNHSEVVLASVKCSLAQEAQQTW